MSEKDVKNESVLSKDIKNEIDKLIQIIEGETAHCCNCQTCQTVNAGVRG